MKSPPGFTCICRTEHKFPPYVYAHSSEELRFTCLKCGAEYTILHLRATLRKTPEKAKGKKQ